MRRIVGIGLASLAASLALPAGAASLLSASLTFRGATTPTVTFPGVGATATSTGPNSVQLLSGTGLRGTATGTFGSGYLRVELAIDGNETGSFTGSPLGGSAAFPGDVKIVTASSSLSVGTLPIALGEVGGTTATLKLPTAGLPIKLGAFAGRWTAGTAMIGSLSATAMGANQLTPGGAGTLLLVSPFAVDGEQAGPPLVAFAELELVFAPEPSRATLLGWGATCLALAGSRRRGTT